MNADAWLGRLFAAIDGMDEKAFAGCLTPDAEFQFGNLPSVRGTAQIEAMVGGFFRSIAGLGHVLHGHWICGDTLICRGTVTYQRRDGKEVALPFANIMRLEGGRACEYRIYGDVSPLYA